MPRRRRAWTNKSRKSRKPSRTADPDAPSDEEWKWMPEYGSFIVKDDNGQDHQFRKGDTATILPHHCTVGVQLHLHQYWIAKIREIRARNDGDVWARVQWYWSGTDVSQVIKSFDSSACGLYERLFSDHYDYVPSTAFDAVVPVQKFKEADLEQKRIGPEEFYSRYNFEFKARKISPRPGADTCICKLPYSPDDSTSIMHFCPRPTCRRFYHQTCLIKAGSGNTHTYSGHASHLLASPDSEHAVSLQHFASPQPPKKKRRDEPSKDAHNDTLSSEELLAQLPTDLVKVAQQPIVRGAGFKSGGVTGNIAVVVHARRTVYAALAGIPVPDDWKDGIDTEESIVRLVGKTPLLAFLCPNCEGVI